MHLTYRGRMIAYNIAIFLLLFCIILFCVVQGTIFVNILGAENDLFQIKKDFPVNHIFIKLLNVKAADVSVGIEAVLYYSTLKQHISV